MQAATSIYLDLIRFIAAAVVLFGHGYPRRLTGGVPWLRRFGGRGGHDAVMVFFVLSGFVIAYVADRKEPTLKDYSISRFASQRTECCSFPRAGRPLFGRLVR